MWSCKRPFISYNMLAQGTQPRSDATQPVFLGQKIPNVRLSKAGSEQHSSNAGFQDGNNVEACRSQKARESDKGLSKGDANGEQAFKVSRKVLNSKRWKKQEVESASGESIGSDNSLLSEEVERQIDTDTLRALLCESDGDCSGRRSSRNKRHASFYESEDASKDEELRNPSKKAKEVGPSGFFVTQKKKK